jgi:hypothetical protein
MHVILFGAGASYGSEPTAQVPPLGIKLFDELIQFAPTTWGTLPTNWSSQFRSDFETAMALFILSGAFAAPLQWDMAEYFFSQFSATKSNVYTALIKALSSNIDRYLFSTINYELMLFQAREMAGVKIDKFQLCLPHGNSCLCCEGVSATRGVSFTGGVSTGGRVRVFKNLADFRAEKLKNVFPPVMSYYEPNKFTVSCSNFIQNERNRFEQAVLSAEKIAVVGVNVHPVDQHIWQPLAKTKAQILYLSGSSAANDFSDWCKNEGRSGDIPIDKYFNNGLKELIIFLL